MVDVAGTPELLPLTYSSSSLSYTTGAAITVGGSGGVFERVFVYPDTTIANAPLLFVTGDSPSESVSTVARRGIGVVNDYFTTPLFPAHGLRLGACTHLCRVGVSNDLGLTFTTLPTYARLRGDIHPNDGTMVVDPQQYG